MDLQSYAMTCAAMSSRCENEQSGEDESGRRTKGASKCEQIFHIFFRMCVVPGEDEKGRSMRDGESQKSGAWLLDSRESRRRRPVAHPGSEKVMGL
jgi:hypothetical protein